MDILKRNLYRVLTNNLNKMVSIEKEKLEKLKEAFNQYYVKYLPVGTHTKIVVRETKRFDQEGGDLELFELNDSGTAIKNLGCWYWNEIRFVGGEVDFVFEKQREYSAYHMEIAVGIGSNFTVYVDKEEERAKFPWPEYGGDTREQSVEDYCNKKLIQTIRKQMAQAILDGDVNITIRCNDTDCYDCPPSKIRNQIIPV